MPVLILREGRLLAVVNNAATATTLLPKFLRADWTVQLVDPPPTPPAIDTMTALLQSLRARDF